MSFKTISTRGFDAHRGRETLITFHVGHMGMRKSLVSAVRYTCNFARHFKQNLKNKLAENINYVSYMRHRYHANSYSFDVACFADYRYRTSLAHRT